MVDQYVVLLADLLTELKSEMKRGAGNFHMKVTPIGFSATARKKMSCFNKLDAAFAHVDSTSWFIIVSPPMKALGSIEKRLPTDPDSKVKRKGKLVGNVTHSWHRDWQLPKNGGVLELSPSQADENHRQVHKFPGDQPQSIHFLAHDGYEAAPHSIEATEGWVAGPTVRGISGPYGHEVRAGSSSSDDASWQISVVSTMSTAKHAKLTEYIQLHEQSWDLDFMVVMPGRGGW